MKNQISAVSEEVTVMKLVMKNRSLRKPLILKNQFVIFKLLSYCFEEIIGFGIEASFESCPVLHLIRLYNKPGDITKEF